MAALARAMSVAIRKAVRCGTWGTLGDSYSAILMVM
jgi:hypothetical protein